MQLTYTICVIQSEWMVGAITVAKVIVINCVDLVARYTVFNKLTTI